VKIKTAHIVLLLLFFDLGYPTIFAQNVIPKSNTEIQDDAKIISETETKKVLKKKRKKEKKKKIRKIKPYEPLAPARSATMRRVTSTNDALLASVMTVLLL